MEFSQEDSIAAIKILTVNKVRPSHVAEITPIKRRTMLRYVDKFAGYNFTKNKSSWKYICNKHQLFSYFGLSPNEVRKLEDEYAGFINKIISNQLSDRLIAGEDWFNGLLNVNHTFKFSLLK